MNIETKWLEDLLSLARTQSFSRSAAERHMTQPAFSRRIKALEEALGCELVDRASVPVRLTAAGELFQITARNLVSQLEATKAHLLSLHKRDRQVVDFALSHSLSLSFFPRLVQSLQLEQGATRYRQLVANVDDSVQALKNDICDFLLAYADPGLHNATFQRLDLSTEQLIPVCRANDAGQPLFDLDSTHATELPYLGYPAEIYLGRCVAKILRGVPHPRTLQLAFESPLADSLKLMALQGMGIAWVPSFAVQEELRQGFLVNCGGPHWRAPLRVCLYRCNRDLSADAESLWTTLSLRFPEPPHAC